MYDLIKYYQQAAGLLPAVVQKNRRSGHFDLVGVYVSASRKLMLPESGFRQTQRRRLWITSNTPSLGRFSHRAYHVSVSAHRGR